MMMAVAMSVIMTMRMSVVIMVVVVSQQGLIGDRRRLDGTGKGQ